MRIRSTEPRYFQRTEAIRLRREDWGGFAFDRAGGDLLELDGEGFDVLAALATAQPLPALRTALRMRGHSVRLPELASFLKVMEGRGFVQVVPPSARQRDLEPWAYEEAPVENDELRAPLVAHWAVTYRCNLQCAFCYSESGPWREDAPSSGFRLRVVERLAGWGVLEVALGGGEPTILPDFPELLAAIRASGMVPNVTTNGTVSNDGVVRSLAEHAGVVHLSYDQPDLLDAVRGRGVSERLRSTVRKLGSAGVRLGVNLLLTPDNVRHVRRSLDCAMELGVQAVTLLRPKGAWTAHRWPHFLTPGDLEALGADLRAFQENRPPLRLYVDTALRGEWVRLGLLVDPEPEVFGCGGGQRHVAVSPEGDVYPCSHARRPDYRMGNLLTDDVNDLWRTGSGRSGRRRYAEDCNGVECPCRSEVSTQATTRPSSSNGPR
jgi:radical SAM protein with 4Fe4S-binding SPASM domain